MTQMNRSKKLLLSQFTPFQLQESQFGQTILETIQMQLQTQEPVQNLVQMLQNLDLQLEAEQRRDDQLHERFQNKCENDLGELESVINDCSTKSKVLQAQLDQLNPQKTQKVSDLNRKNSELIDLKAELESQTDNRSAEQKTYEKTLDDLEAALYALNEARKMFNDFLDVLLKNKKKFAGSSFTQENEVPQSEQEEEHTNMVQEIFSNEGRITTFAQVTSKLNKLKRNIKLEGYNFLFQALAHLTSKLQSNPSEEHEKMTRKILEIITQVETYIQKSRVVEDQAEQSRREAFLGLQQMFTDQIIFLQKEQNALQGSIDSLSSQITSGNNEKFEIDQKMEVKQKEFNDRELECRNEVMDYSTEKNKRDKERQSLNEAIEIVTTELGQLKKAIMEKGF